MKRALLFVKSGSKLGFCSPEMNFKNALTLQWRVYRGLRDRVSNTILIALNSFLIIYPNLVSILILLIWTKQLRGIGLIAHWGNQVIREDMRLLGSFILLVSLTFILFWIRRKIKLRQNK